MPTYATIAVLDNTALRYLYLIGQLHNLCLLYTEVYIPTKVEEEFLSIQDKYEQTQRITFLFEFYSRHVSWFKKCNTGSDDIQAIVLATIEVSRKKVHAGEAEVMAQAQQLPGNAEAIIDEHTARKFFERIPVTIKGTCFLLALLHHKWTALDYFETIKELRKHGFRVSEEVANAAYNQARFG